MNPSNRISLAAALTAATATLAAHAQTTGPGIGYDLGNPVRVAQAPTTSAPTPPPAARSDIPRDSGYSLLPGTRRGYFGINLGKPDFKTGCGSGVFGCDNPNLGVSVYTGGLFNDWVGAEVGFMSTGKADRAGGSTRAQGINLSLLMRAPLDRFNVFAKGGVMYGETRVSSALFSGVPSGKARGWGPTYGAGAGYDFTARSGMVVEWSRSQLRFPGVSGRQDVDTTSLGYVHRF